MKTEHIKIIEKISEFLQKHPEQRFGQALANLKINQFANEQMPDKEKYQLRDIYHDQDSKILERIESSNLI